MMKNPAMMMRGVAAAVVLLMSAVPPPAQAFLPSWSRPARWIKQNIMKEATLILEKSKGSSFQEFWNDTVANVQQNMDRTMSEVQKNMSFNKKSEEGAKTSKKNFAFETSPFQIDEEEVLQFRGAAGEMGGFPTRSAMEENFENEWNADVQQPREDFFASPVDMSSDEEMMIAELEKLKSETAVLKAQLAVATAKIPTATPENATVQKQKVKDLIAQLEIVKEETAHLKEQMKATPAPTAAMASPPPQVPLQSENEQAPSLRSELKVDSAAPKQPWSPQSAIPKAESAAPKQPWSPQSAIPKAESAAPKQPWSPQSAIPKAESAAPKQPWSPQPGIPKTESAAPKQPWSPQPGIPKAELTAPKQPWSPQSAIPKAESAAPKQPWSPQPGIPKAESVAPKQPWSPKAESSPSKVSMEEVFAMVSGVNAGLNQTRRLNETTSKMETEEVSKEKAQPSKFVVPVAKGFGKEQSAESATNPAKKAEVTKEYSPLDSELGALKAVIGDLSKTQSKEQPPSPKAEIPPAVLAKKEEPKKISKLQAIEDIVNSSDSASSEATEPAKDTGLEKMKAVIAEFAKARSEKAAKDPSSKESTVSAKTAFPMPKSSGPVTSADEKSKASTPKQVKSNDPVTFSAKSAFPLPASKASKSTLPSPGAGGPARTSVPASGKEKWTPTTAKLEKKDSETSMEPKLKEEARPNEEAELRKEVSRLNSELEELKALVAELVKQKESKMESPKSVTVKASSLGDASPTKTSATPKQTGSSMGSYLDNLAPAASGSAKQQTDQPKSNPFGGASYLDSMSSSTTQAKQGKESRAQSSGLTLDDDVPSWRRNTEPDSSFAFSAGPKAKSPKEPITQSSGVTSQEGVPAWRRNTELDTSFAFAAQPKTRSPNEVMSQRSGVMSQEGVPAWRRNADVDSEPFMQDSRSDAMYDGSSFDGPKEPVVFDSIRKNWESKGPTPWDSPSQRTNEEEAWTRPEKMVSTDGSQSDMRTKGPMFDEIRQLWDKEGAPQKARSDDVTFIPSPAPLVSPPDDSSEAWYGSGESSEAWYGQDESSEAWYGQDEMSDNWDYPDVMVSRDISQSDMRTKGPMFDEIRNLWDKGGARPSPQDNFAFRQSSGVTSQEGMPDWRRSEYDEGPYMNRRPPSQYDEPRYEEGPFRQRSGVTSQEGVPDWRRSDYDDRSSMGPPQGRPESSDVWTSPKPMISRDATASELQTKGPVFADIRKLWDNQTPTHIGAGGSQQASASTVTQVSDPRQRNPPPASKGPAFNLGKMFSRDSSSESPPQQQAPPPPPPPREKAAPRVQPPSQFLVTPGGSMFEEVRKSWDDQGRTHIGAKGRTKVAPSWQQSQDSATVTEQREEAAYAQQSYQAPPEESYQNDTTDRIKEPVTFADIRNMWEDPKGRGF